MIKRVTNLKYLGIIVDEMITRKDHVRALTIKIPPGTGILNRLKHFIPHKALKTLYYTVVSSYLEHGCALLSNLFSYNTRKIQLQNWAVKTLFSYKYSTSDSSPTGESSKMFLKYLCSKLQVKLCINSLEPLGQRQLNMFQIASEYDSYPTTSSENNLLISEMRHSHRSALSLRHVGVEV